MRAMVKPRRTSMERTRLDGAVLVMVPDIGFHHRSNGRGLEEILVGVVEGSSQGVTKGPGLKPLFSLASFQGPEGPCSHRIRAFARMALGFRGSAVQPG